MSDVPLTLRYRPRRFADVVGQPVARLVLQKMILDGDVKPALLFYGSFGSGKTSCARLFASALNCEHSDVSQRPCGECGVCVSTSRGVNSDVAEIDAASSGLVDDIRALREQVRFASRSRYRVVILDECHAMSAKGFQALLKILEEPPENTVFILVTTVRTKVPDTIISRCLSLEFRRISEKQIADRLFFISQEEGVVVEYSLCQDIAARSQGIARDAVALLEQCFLVHIKSPKELSILLGDVNYGVQIVRALAGGQDSYPAAFDLAYRALGALPSVSEVVAGLVTTLRRILVLTLSSDVSVLSPPPASEEISLASVLDTQCCVSAIKVIWEYYSRVAAVSDAYAAMDLLLTMLGQALSPVRSRSSVDLSSMVKGR